MALIQLLSLTIALLSTVNSQECEIISVDKEDMYGTIGTCCVTWDERFHPTNNRKFFGGFGTRGSLGGFLKDSARNRTMKGEITTNTAIGLVGDDPIEDPAPAPAPIIKVTAPAPPPPQYPPQYGAYAPASGYRSYSQVPGYGYGMGYPGMNRYG